MKKFDASIAVDLIERHRVNFAAMVPIHLHRIIKLSGVRERDFSSIDAIVYSAASCPGWLKRAWIDLIGAEKLYEGFGATEAIGHTAIRGDEWLEHPNSVGKPLDCELQILDENGNELPPGEVGEIYMRPFTSEPTYAYVGSPSARSTTNGFISVGDLGWNRRRVPSGRKITRSLRL